MSAIFKACVTGQGEMRISSLQWGEVSGRLRKRLGAAEAMRVLENLTTTDLEVIPASGDRAIHAAELRLERKIAYADGFALDLAMDSPSHVLVTADYDFKVVADLAQIELLSLK